MRALLVCLMLFGSAAMVRAQARAGGEDVGVVVAGEASMQPLVTAHIQGWLERNGHRVAGAPMPPDAISSLIDCFAVQDEPCARKVVEERATATSVVFARIDLDPEASERSATMVAYWLERAGGEPVAQKGYCERCSDRVLETSTDKLITALAQASKKQPGLLKLTTSPAGARVHVGGELVGETPLERHVAPGSYKVALRLDGHAVEARDVTVRAGETTALDVPLAPEGGPGRGGRGWLPPALVVGGAALVVTGVVLFVTSDTDDGTKYEYISTRPPGIALGVAGLAAAGIGAYLWTRKRASAPIVAITPGAVHLGWSRRF